MMKKILSIFLALSFVVQPAYSVAQAAQPKKKGIITKAKEKWSEFKEAMSKGNAVLKANWKCFTTGKGEGCSKDRHMALQIIRNFVTGKTKEAKEGLLAFLKKHVECWVPILKGVVFVGVPLGMVGLEVIVGDPGILGLISLYFGVGKLVHDHEKKMGERAAKGLPELTFAQKMKNVGKCMLVIGIDIAIVTALTYIIVAMINKENEQQLVNQGVILSEVKELDEKNLLVHIMRGLERGVDVNAIKYRDKPAIIYAVKHGYAEAVKFLILKKANLNQSNTIGNTPLHIAAQKGNKEIAQALIDAGADTNVFNNERKKPYELTTSAELQEILQPKLKWQ